MTGKVIRVADGDTATVQLPGGTSHRVRFLGIDAPEHDQEGGSESSISLISLIMGREVTVRYRATDQYGRILGKVLLDGRDINLEQIRNGNAWFYRHYAKTLFRGDAALYEKAESEAKEKRTGLWKDPSPLPPWDYRRQNRLQKNSAAAGLSEVQKRSEVQDHLSFLQRLKDWFY